MVRKVRNCEGREGLERETETETSASQHQVSNCATWMATFAPLGSTHSPLTLLAFPSTITHLASPSKAPVHVVPLIATTRSGG
jgi:hypothetical protein